MDNLAKIKIKKKYYQSVLEGEIANNKKLKEEEAALEKKIANLFGQRKVLEEQKIEMFTKMKSFEGIIPQINSCSSKLKYCIQCLHAEDKKRKEIWDNFNEQDKALDKDFSVNFNSIIAKEKKYDLNVFNQEVKKLDAKLLNQIQEIESLKKTMSDKHIQADMELELLTLDIKSLEEVKKEQCKQEKHLKEYYEKKKEIKENLIKSNESHNIEYIELKAKFEQLQELRNKF